MEINKNVHLIFSYLCPSEVQKWEQTLLLQTNGNWDWSSVNHSCSLKFTSSFCQTTLYSNKYASLTFLTADRRMDWTKGNSDQPEMCTVLSWTLVVPWTAVTVQKRQWPWNGFAKCRIREKSSASLWSEHTLRVLPVSKDFAALHPCSCCSQGWCGHHEGSRGVRARIPHQLHPSVPSSQLLRPHTLCTPRFCPSSAVCWCGDSDDTGPEQLCPWFPGALNHLSTDHKWGLSNVRHCFQEITVICSQNYTEWSCWRMLCAPSGSINQKREQKKVTIAKILTIVCQHGLRAPKLHCLKGCALLITQ